VYVNGQQFRAGVGITTMHPTFDWETYSEAGYQWNYVTQKWESLPGLGPQNRGIGAVGAYNYITHPTFEVLSLAYDLLDGRGMRHWVPHMTEFGLADEPHDLIQYAAAGGILEAFNVGFELYVWNLYCAPRWGWKPLLIEQVRCCMAKARAHALPGSLADVGYVLDLVNKKDPMGDYLIKKLTVPKNPGNGGPRKPADMGPRPGRRPPQQTDLTKPEHPPACKCSDCDIPF
jgi:hypothetical protein